MDGFRFTSKVSGYEDRSIFIPSAGYYSGTTATYVGSRMGYWTASGNVLEASYLAHSASWGGYSAVSRCEGHPVRAVYMPRVSLTSFEFSTTAITLRVEQKERISTVCEPYESTEHGAIWTSSNPAIAKVSGWGEVTGVSPGTATITAVSIDGGFTATCQVTVKESYVDMGNGYEWATYNIGADSPYQSGDYFAWGELHPKDTYSWDNYQFGNESSIWRYTSTSQKYLQRYDDIATAEWGTDWHIPSEADWQWLIDNCVWWYTDDYNETGTAGYLVISRITNGTIFLPSVGYCSPGYEGGTKPYTLVPMGCYWSSDLSSESDTQARYLLNHNIITTRPRCDGLPVRPVRRVSVDMGNGLKWATRNVGATVREYEYGNYFAWGDPNVKGNYCWDYYRWMQEGESDKYHITKYTVADGQTAGIWYDAAGNFIGDGKTVVEAGDDIATLSLGSSWHTPTDAEWTWLRTNCTWTWTDDYQGSGIAGQIVTSNVSGFEGNTIFLPAAGYWIGSSPYDAGSRGFYWSSSLTTSYLDSAWGVYFFSGYVDRSNSLRYIGRSVRPVSE